MQAVFLRAAATEVDCAGADSPTIHFCVGCFRQAVFLRAAATKVDCAGAVSCGGPGQQADGQVHRRVSGWALSSSSSVQCPASTLS